VFFPLLVVSMVSVLVMKVVWNMISLYRAGSPMTAVEEVSKLS
jgi:TRAP-type C4-dicarboxylate transport system permease small subunit